MMNLEWPEVLETMLDCTASGYDRSRAFATFIADEKHLIYLDDVETLLKDENSSLRSEVVRTLGRIPRRDYHPLLGIALLDADDYVVREALRGLVDCQDKAIVEVIEGLAKTASLSTRYEAERTLSLISDKANQPPDAPPVDGAVETTDVRSKTEEMALSMNVIPESTPYPVKRHVSRKDKRRVQLNTPDEPSMNTGRNRHEGFIVTIVSLMTIGGLILLLIR